MVRVASVLTILVAMAWSASQVLAAPSAARSGPCFPAGSKTLAVSDQLRVYKKANGARYGCVFKTGKRALLATPPKPLRAIRAGGLFAAYSQAPYFDGGLGDDVPWEVVSVGLCRRDGRRYKYIVATTR